jgi:hypothetical protein
VRAELLDRREPDQLEIDVIDPAPNCPSWILIEPDSMGQRFWTEPPGHQLEENDGTSGPPAMLLETARRTLAGDLSNEDAARLVDSALADWSQSRQ